jgi:glyoxylase-like metal-dependent hydrolase (beta-lactamase superfamily II)/rhodanese-related sulfurtransferase
MWYGLTLLRQLFALMPFKIPKGGTMTLQAYSAQELFDYLINKDDFILLDVRNDEEFGRFKVEGPYPFDMINVPYMEFIEHEQESVAKVPQGRKIRIVCAKEGSAKFVGEILNNHGFEDVHYLSKGIKSWGNLLSPIKLNHDGAYDLYQFRRPGKASCSYALVFGKEMMLFDPAKNIAAYQEFAEQLGCAITHTFETHRQADYISGSQALNQAVGAAIMAPEPDFTGAKFFYTGTKDGAVYPFSDTADGMPEVKALHTPGHTPGSTCYLIDNKFLLTGDTVFIYSIGRPDLGGMAKEWSAMLFNTMTEKILALDDAIHILPGHYMNWEEADDQLRFMASLGKIKSINAAIYGIDNEDDFYQFIKSNMRPQPEEYAKIREINAGLVEVDEEQQDVMDLGKNECAASAQPH